MIEQPQDAKLLGGQKIWDTCNRAVSSKLESLRMTSEEVTQVLSNDVIVDKIAELCFSARPGAKSATTPEIAKHIPQEWSVKDDVPLSLSQAQKLEFISFLESGEEYISGGETMCSRAVRLGGNRGLADAVWLIENQHLIPAELRGKYIVLPGTLLRDSDGDLNVPYLRWDDGRWILSFRLLGGISYSNARLVSRK